MKTTGEKIEPFSNGFEFRGWKDRNCSLCDKYEDESTKVEEAGCKLAFYIDLGSVSDGTIPKAIADEFGCEIERGFFTNCKNKTSRKKE